MRISRGNLTGSGRIPLFSCPLSLSPTSYDISERMKNKSGVEGLFAMAL
jgi:hypothetical protein